MQWLSKSCHFMHLMQNRCTRILQALGGRDPGGGGGGGNHYTARGWKGPVTKNFIIFHPILRRWIVHIVIFFPSSPYKPLNNLGSFQAEVFAFLCAHYPEFRAEVLNHPG